MLGTRTQGCRMENAHESTEIRRQSQTFRNPASFCLFSFFSITILQKNCRPQWDSNSDCQSRRGARWPLDHHHGPSDFIVINHSFRIKLQTLAGIITDRWSRGQDSLTTKPPHFNELRIWPYYEYKYFLLHASWNLDTTIVTIIGCLMVHCLTGFQTKNVGG